MFLIVNQTGELLKCFKANPPLPWPGGSWPPTHPSCVQWHKAHFAVLFADFFFATRLPTFLLFLLPEGLPGLPLCQFAAEQDKHTHASAGTCRHTHARSRFTRISCTRKSRARKHQFGCCSHRCCCCSLMLYRLYQLYRLSVPRLFQGPLVPYYKDSGLNPRQIWYKMHNMRVRHTMCARV